MKANNKGKHPNSNSRPTKGYDKSKGYGSANKGSRNSSNAAKEDTKIRSSNIINRCDGRENSPEWYSRTPQGVRDTASIPWNGVLGNNVSLEFAPTQLSNVFEYRFPGIITNHFIPTYGFAAGSTDTKVSAGNIASQNIYTWVRHENSGSRNYEAPDLMMYLAALDSLYMLMAIGRRWYGISRRYSVSNRYYGKYLMQASGLSAEEAEKLCNDPIMVRSFVNTAMIRIASLNAPADMPIFKRHFWLCDNVWLDSESQHAKIIMFVPKNVYRFNATQYETGTSLDVVNLPDTWDDYVELVNSCINALVANEDAGVMSGDIRKAYTNTYQLELLDSDYVVTPAFSTEVRDQWTNTMYLGQGAVSANVIQNSGLIYHSVANTTTSRAGLSGAKLGLLYSDMDDPSYNMVALRNRFVVEESINAINGTLVNSTKGVVNSGSEVFTHWIIWTIDKNGSMQGSELATVVNSVSAPTQALMSTIEKHPPVYAIGIQYVDEDDTSKGHEVISATVYADIDRYTLVSEDMVRRMNDVAILSLWNVPI